MSDQKKTIYIDDASEAASQALKKSGQPLGGEVASDEDPLFAAMMAEGDGEGDSSFFDELASSPEVEEAQANILKSASDLASMKLEAVVNNIPTDSDE